MTVAAALAVLLLILIAGALVDVYRLQETRAWAYRAAESAALAGTFAGRDLASVYSDPIRLDPVAGRAGAARTLDEEIALRGIAGANYRIEASEFGMDTFAGFPPVPRADLWGSGDWVATEPAVGVYIEIDVPTFLLGLTHQGVVTVHAFAAAGVSQP